MQVRGSPLQLPFSPDRESIAAWGDDVVSHRTSLVRRGDLPGIGPCYVKFYELSTLGHRLRAWPRSMPRRTRACREFDALLWLADRGIQPALQVGVFEWRADEGLVRGALLATRAFGDSDLESLLQRPGIDRRKLMLDASTFIDSLHEVGFEDRNLDPRNILAQSNADGWQFAKIDSPRHRIRGRPLTATARAEDRRRMPFEL